MPESRAVAERRPSARIAPLVPLLFVLQGSVVARDGGAGREPAAPPVQEARIASFVLRRAALDNVRDLVALGPRMGGTASGARAAWEVSQRLRELGLEAELIQDPERPVHEESSWSVELGRLRLESAWPYGFSPSRPRVAAPLVAEPAGGSDASAAGPAAWRGAVVLASRGARAVYQRAVDAGAVAMLIDHPADPTRYVTWAPIHELDREPGPPPIPAFGLSYLDGRRLREALAATRQGDPPPRVTVSLVSRLLAGRPLTVSATLRGAGKRAGEVLVMCAHGDSDSGGPGADDNASGVAALIEVARALTKAAARGMLPADRPSVTFLVWGAETHSSGAWLRARAEGGAIPSAVINFDQCGTGAQRDALYYEGNDIEENRRLLGTLQAVGEAHAGGEGFWTEHTSTPRLGGTDSDVFLAASSGGAGIAGRGIPATTIFTAAWDRPRSLPQPAAWRSSGWPEPLQVTVDYSAYYHSSGDLPAATTEAEPYNLERCARLAALGIYRLMRDGPAAP